MHRPLAAAGATPGKVEASDVFIGQAVEPVAHDPGLPQVGRQREHLGQLGLGPVERGVEAGHLREPGRALQYAADGREVVGLMQGSERDEGLQAFQHPGIHAHRTNVVESAVHHAVPDPDQPVVRQLPPQVTDQVVEGLVMPEPRTVRPGLLGPGRPVGRLRNESRLRVQALDLAPNVGLQVVAALQIKGKFDARRAGVDYDDGIGHGAGFLVEGRI